MKNTVQKYLFYLKQQNERAKKNVLQHTLTTKHQAIKPINKIEFKYKKRLSEAAACQQSASL